MKKPPISAAIALMLLLASHLCGQQKSGPQKSIADDSQKTSPASDYLRILRNDRGVAVAMQTSIVPFRFRDQTNSAVVVELIGAVHVADKAYFRALNKAFEKYDALLYELVAPEDNNVPQDGNSRHPVGQMQQGLKSMLELSFQLEEIDYTKKNFVHADMSPAEFARVMKDRGESMLQMMLGMMGSAMAMQSGNGGGSDAELLFALFAKDRALRLKRVMSTQFQNLDGTMAAIEGPQGSTLIGMRNKKALDVLRRELSSGKQRIGVFYGAGHMPDMEKRLEQEFGLIPDKSAIQWLTAWNMKGK